MAKKRSIHDTASFSFVHGLRSAAISLDDEAARKVGELGVFSGDQGFILDCFRAAYGQSCHASNPSDRGDGADLAFPSAGSALGRSDEADWLKSAKENPKRSFIRAQMNGQIEGHWAWALAFAGACALAIEKASGRMNEPERAALWDSAGFLFAEKGWLGAAVVFGRAGKRIQSADFWGEVARGVFQGGENFKDPALDGMDMLSGSEKKSLLRALRLEAAGPQREKLLKMASERLKEEESRRHFGRLPENQKTGMASSFAQKAIHVSALWGDGHLPLDDMEKEGAKILLIAQRPSSASAKDLSAQLQHGFHWAPFRSKAQHVKKDREGVPEAKKEEPLSAQEALRGLLRAFAWQCSKDSWTRQSSGWPERIEQHQAWLANEMRELPKWMGSEPKSLGKEWFVSELEHCAKTAGALGWPALRIILDLAKDEGVALGAKDFKENILAKALRKTLSRPEPEDQNGALREKALIECASTLMPLGFPLGLRSQEARGMGAFLALIERTRLEKDLPQGAKKKQGRRV